MAKIKKIILASNNKGKINELLEILRPYNIEILPQVDYAVPDIDETGLTFVENALLKARNASHVTGLPAIADDSGLVVDALLGAPGIYSARYAGSPSNDINNINKLLNDLAEQSATNRSARYICVIVFLRHENDPSPIICQGVWEGSILKAPQGTGGFGYDPIFYVPTHQCSAAELSSAEKNRLSHRGQAMQQLLEKLSKWINSEAT